jgi:hypothetical protein
MTFLLDAQELKTGRVIFGRGDAEPATPRSASYFSFSKKMVNIMNWKDAAPAHTL